MAGPWEDFAPQAASGPWEDFKPSQQKPAEVSTLGRLWNEVKSIPRGIVSGAMGAASALGQAEAGQQGMEGVPGQAESTRLIEQNVTGKLPSGGKWGTAIGESLGNPASYVGPGGLLGKAAAAVIGGIGSEAGGQLTNDSLLGRIIGGAAGGGLAGAGASKIAAIKAGPDIPAQAASKVAQRFEQDVKGGGLTAQDAITRVNDAAAKGKPMTLADVGGENVKGLAGNVARQPGESRNIASQFLNQRDEGAAARLGQDISKYISGGPSMHKTTEDLIRARSKAANPLYEVAMAAPIPETPQIKLFLADPTVKKGMAAGIESQRLEALAAGLPYKPSPPGANMRTLDAVKRGLDAMIDGERDAITGRLSQRGVMLDRVRRSYVDELDKMNPEYAKARAAWAGPSQSLDAVRQGRTLFQRSPEEIAAEFGGLGAGNQEFYRLGVADAIRERMAKTGLSGDEAKSLIKNQWMRDQLKPIFRTPAEFDAFVDAVTQERQMFGTKFETLGGSQTARRLAEDQSGENMLAAGGAHIAENVATGRWLSAAKNAIRLYRDVGLRPNPKLNEEISRILFATPIKPDMAKQLTAPAAMYRPPNPTLAAAIRGGLVGGTRPNPEQQYLDKASDAGPSTGIMDMLSAFASGGLQGVANARGIETPGWSKRIGETLSGPAANAALGVMGGPPERIGFSSAGLRRGEAATEAPAAAKAAPAKATSEQLTAEQRAIERLEAAYKKKLAAQEARQAKVRAEMEAAGELDRIGFASVNARRKD
jgi:hypothetical protein